MNAVYGATLVCVTALLLAACGGSESSAGGGVASSSPSSPASSLASSSASSVSSSHASTSSSEGPVLSSNFVLGADISWVSEMEASGRRFYNRAGEEIEAFALMQALGVNAIRLRVWVNPADGWYNSPQDVVAKARRAKEQGQRIMIDFHYSDNWADPGKQTKPAAWADYTLEELQDALVEHTHSTLQALKDEGVTPEWVQVGNETNDGFLWDSARPSVEPRATNMKNYADLTSAGYDAVKAVFPDALVIVHLANCHDNANFRWIFDGLTSNNARFDVIGASSYPLANSPMTWQTSTANCLVNLNDMVTRYGVPVMLTEIGLPWDHVNAKTVVADLINKTAAVKDGMGLGVFYWEPLSYYGWKGYTLGAFDDSGKPAAAMEAITEAAARIARE
ncbi:glycoside hydrolase family 53 protein [Cellvibrio japonicus]|nr:glycosyl hydrolase 53 family protein [Cellvibrio japonicus]QEI11190.1 arabinogalactan endo-1,4-beta-galactosidase [Cellvibrio japonicus]QEI14764.1 arabinogalactan endo-1,4-beta-galactosidase [Cellvibrio japonicus]QEI18344.1 arabinogalactan endo-1,4-beta-galactosidase [Cellvibrio japonicus]